MNPTVNQMDVPQYIAHRSAELIKLSKIQFLCRKDCIAHVLETFGLGEDKPLLRYGAKSGNCVRFRCEGCTEFNIIGRREMIIETFNTSNLESQ